MPNSSINTIQDEKKILGCCIEKYGDNQVALCSKCYTIWNNDETIKSLKVKGISLKTNKLTLSDYEEVINNGTVKKGINKNLQMKNITEGGVKTQSMTKITINKNALTGFHNKRVTLSNGGVIPSIACLTAQNYFECTESVD